MLPPQLMMIMGLAKEQNVKKCNESSISQQVFCRSKEDLAKSAPV
jgi:hypothetical protein